MVTHVVSHDDDDGEGDAQTLSDSALIARHLDGQQDAFAGLVDRYARHVYAIAYRISGDHAEAEDLTQDAFLRAFRALPTLRGHGSFAGWLYRVATTTSLDGMRRRAPRQTPLDAALADILPDGARWSSPVDMALAAEDQRAVRAAFRRLAPRQRAALALHALHGLSYADTARAMDTTVDAVAVLIFRARRRIRAHYARMPPDGRHGMDGEDALGPAQRPSVRHGRRPADRADVARALCPVSLGPADVTQYG